MPLGYDPTNVMRLGIMLHVHDPGDLGRRIRSHDVRAAYIEQIRASIASVPGVSIVAVGINATPPNTGAVEDSFNIDGNSNREQLQARVMLVSQQYFAALHIPVVRGASGMRMKTSAAISLPSSTARSRHAIFPHPMPWVGSYAFPISQRGVALTVTSAQSTAWRQIIGVVGDARNDGVDRSVVPAIYLPYTTVMQPYAQFLVRTQGDPLTYLHSIRAAIASVGSDQEVSNGTFTLSEAIERDAQYSRQRLFSILFGVFSTMALMLALAGISSVVAYSVAQRTTEFGIRLALGAPRAHVLWVAVRIALVSAVAGMVLGLAVDSFLGAVLAHWMQNAFAAASLFAAAALLALSALAACLLPARHAIAVPPAEALRYE